MSSLLRESVKYVNPNKSDIVIARIVNTDILRWLWLAAVVTCIVLIAKEDWTKYNGLQILMITSAMVITVIAGAVISLAIVAALQDTFGAYKRHLFHNQRQAVIIFSTTRALLKKLGGIAAVANLHVGLSHFQSHLFISPDYQSTSQTPGGYCSNTGALPENDEEAFVVLMREALHSWLLDIDNGDKTGEEVPENSKEFTLFPSNAQDYIIQFYPDLILVNPMRFDKGHLDAYCPGLSSVVLGLQSMSYTHNQVIEASREWVNTDSQLSHTTIGKVLPNDFV